MDYAQEPIGGAILHARLLAGSKVGQDRRARGDFRHRRRAAASVGLLTTLISLIAASIPSYWSDEVATLRAARLAWSDLFEFLDHKDAVHTAYYSIMKLWLGLFGESEVAARSLSAVAIGAAAAGTVVLVSSMTGMRLAVLAGIIFAILPRTTYAGIEARSFALSAAFAVWATVLLVVAARRQDWRWWSAYAVISAAATYVFLDSVLMLAAHVVFLLWSYRSRWVLVPWALAAASAAVASAPIFILAVLQKDQIAWLAEQPTVNVWTILVEPAFDSSWLVAAIAWCALAAIAVRGRETWSGDQGVLFRLAATWFLVPLVVLLAADAIVGPLYTARYLSFTTPAVAVLLAIAFTRSSRTYVPWVLVGVLVLAGLPTYLAQRGPSAKNGGSDLAEIADYIHANARAGDAIYLQDTGSVTRRPRQALYAYPDSFSSTEDVSFEASFATTGTFSDQTKPLDDLAPELARVDRIWVATANAAGSKADIAARTSLDSLGFVEVSAHETNRSFITLYER